MSNVETEKRPPEKPECPANANTRTRQYFDSILVEERLLDATIPNLKTTILGNEYDSPIMMPAFSHLNHFAKDGRRPMNEYAVASKQMNLLNWIGMCENDEFEAFSKDAGPCVRIIKPYKEREKIFDQIRFAEEHGALAVGMDIDHIFGEDGQLDLVFGELMETQTTADLAEYVQATKLPFVVKGVLSVSDAVKCADCGVKGLLISHHSGRMPFAIPPIMILPKIKEALKGRNVELYVDCGINSGVDAYKALALGANAVAVGRAMMPGLMKDGAAGVTAKLMEMNNELRQMMAYTGVEDVTQFDSSVLWLNGQTM